MDHEFVTMESVRHGNISIAVYQCQKVKAEVKVEVSRNQGGDLVTTLRTVAQTRLSRGGVAQIHKHSFTNLLPIS